MDSKKAIFILALGLFALVLLISSEVLGRDLTEISSKTKMKVVEQTNNVNDTKYLAGEAVVVQTKEDNTHA
ncbi:unnamed protein product [Trifolium pratense]|uniref:Uncharacterized protein n=1 Tax=Trifolium pratense TaxID=57577 RepID=A0ACB0IQ14_TRIPR|nr:unnamed protein product [Trifolium pratense]